MSYENENDIQQKIAKFAQILGNINTCKATLVQKLSRIKVYKALHLPLLLFGSKIWTLRKKDIKLLTSIGMNFFQKSSQVHLS
jgi:hypothetical protein